MAKRWILFLGTVLMLLSGCCKGRTRGKKFLTAFLLNLRESQPNAKFELLITAHRPATTVTVTINEPNFQKIISLSEGHTVSVQLPTSTEMQGTGIYDSTVLIQANKEISVLCHSHKDYSTGATVLYPDHQLGQLYYVVTPVDDLPHSFKEFAIIADQDPTQVNIHLKGPVTFKRKVYPAGSKLVIDLKAFQVIQLQSTEDLSGTRIESTKPVAVLSGHSCAKKFTSCDHVVEQLLPVPNWGTTFIVPSLSYQNNFDVAYVVASQNTLITYQSGVKEKSHNLVAGEVFQIALTSSEPLYISADAKIQVLSFFTGATTGNRSYTQLLPLVSEAPEGSSIYDPFLINIPSLASYCRQYHVYEMKQKDNYIVIIANTSESSQIILGKRAIENVHWRPVPGTDYSWAELLLGSEAKALSVEHPTSPFGLLIAGGSYRDGYGSVALCSCRLSSSSSEKPQELPLTTPVKKTKESLLYPYGTDQGDAKNPKADDGSSPKISTDVSFPFYGKDYHYLYVDNNGVISFGMTLPEFAFTPDPLPLKDGPPLIAPFWGDVYTPIKGEVFWRQTWDFNLLKRCTEDINQFFPEISFTAAWAFIATWDNVAYYGSKTKKVNTFQVVLTTDGELSFVMFNYADIQWTTGTASGGNAKTGLGGIPAQAGFDNGDKVNYYIMPGSRTSDIINIAETSNVNSPGFWIFQVDQIVSGVSTDCYF
ncbi:IgGFc-binding protein-like [Python bivittatus]|uniref:IgGFc-binding protein-like n=1 Tax=Python bivittatus TaxID=176946 RepID=A0A9F2R124_PYTBI|nr:IgGFc-binding protein-like [Python bivittatus]